MEEKKLYNGWTNYETWCVNLWLENEESEYNYWCEQAAILRKEYEESAQEYILAEMLKFNLETRAGVAIDEANVLADLLGAAISEVNFGEIAKDILSVVEAEEND